ncbi:MAG: transaldolase [Polyangiaceae bacterium]
MSSSILAQLRKVTVVVADTGDVNAIEKFVPQDATTNPSLIAAAAGMPAYASLVDDALKFARTPGAAPEEVVSKAIDRLAVEFGLRILKIIPGRVSTEVDARLSFDQAGTIAKAKSLIAQYEAAGVSRDRILIKIAATWEGIRAAEVLEKEGIHCNLTLLFGFHQAVACAEAGVTLISPFVGRILDWYKKNTGKDSYAPADDPGVVSVTRIYNYFKCHDHKTEVMGASFRNVGEIVELAGCDLLTISPQLLAELDGQQGTLAVKLSKESAKKLHMPKLTMNEEVFRKMHAEDPMATDKLAEGIDGFTKALVGLEKQLSERLSQL